MGRRSKADLYDLALRIEYLHDKEKLTFAQIAEKLKEEGYSVSRESVRRSYKSSSEIAAQYKKAMEESRVIIETVRNNPNTDVVETITSMLAGQLFEYIKTVDELDFDDSVQLVGAVKDLATSQVKISKLRLDFQKGYETARQDFLETLKKELTEYPDLLSQLTAIVARMESPQ